MAAALQVKPATYTEGLGPEVERLRGVVRGLAWKHITQQEELSR